jgi:SAM-dependent methyltransferase
MPRERRLSFGEVAELYDESRPSYPDELIDDVIAHVGVSPGQTALEVGAGTGRATLLMAARGLSVVALEPSAEMAAVARRNCAPYAGVRIEQTDLEHWRGEGARYPLVFSAQAWHWVAPEARYPAARAALREGGTFAAFWNRVDWRASELREEILAAYEGAGVEPDGPMHPAQPEAPELGGSWEREIDAAAGLAAPEVRVYGWDCEYSTDAYVALLGTHGDHIMLDADRRASLLRSVARAIDAHGGAFVLRYVTILCLARASTR